MRPVQESSWQEIKSKKRRTGINHGETDSEARGKICRGDEVGAVGRWGEQEIDRIEEFS
jgi:hypothetical protein